VTSTESESAVSYPPAFERAVARVLANEGGYACNPADPGGETRFGICKREYPQVDITSLTREGAVAIYFRDWWLRYHYSDLPGPIGAKLFDLAVNIGPEHAAHCLQRALRACGRRVDEDGLIGEETRTAAPAANQIALIAALRSEAAGYYRTLAASEHGRHGGGASEFLNGWLNRAYA
jgi:lysozyme family protein